MVGGERVVAAGVRGEGEEEGEQWWGGREGERVG